MWRVVRVVEVVKVCRVLPIHNNLIITSTTLQLLQLLQLVLFPLRPILQGLGNMLRLNAVPPLQIRDRAPKFEDAVVTPGREVHLGYGLAQKFNRLFIQLAMFPNVFIFHLGIRGNG